MLNSSLLFSNKNGLYCEVGDFYIDPWKPVHKAIITHGHRDHARWGSKFYLAVEEGVSILHCRLGKDAKIETLKWGEEISINGVKVSFHPAGHILGSAQIRLEYKGEIWVVSGDYKLEPDITCSPFEPIECNVFITESTFCLPIYQWKPQEEVFLEINKWWKKNADRNKASVIFGYPLGKAQRILANLDPTIGPIYTHGSVETINKCYRSAFIQIPETKLAIQGRQKDFNKSLIVAPPSANGTPWIKRFGNYSSAFASGWMAIRGNRRRRAIDKGFILSDHADWNGILTAIKESKAEKILVTHGYTETLVRFLREKGYNAQELKTLYEGELLEEEDLGKKRGEEEK